jgi:hypothetical protein
MERSILLLMTGLRMFGLEGSVVGWLLAACVGRSDETGYLSASWPLLLVSPLSKSTLTLLVKDPEDDSPCPRRRKRRRRISAA